MSRLNLTDDEVIDQLNEQIDEAPQEGETQEYEARLVELIPCYKENKEQADKYSKAADEENKEIKKIFLANSLEEFAVGDTRVTVTTASKDVMNEEAMIDKIKDLQQNKKITKKLLSSIIKTREYIDQDALESALYNEKIKGADLTGCFSTKETVTLRLGKAKKSKKEEEE